MNLSTMKASRFAQPFSSRIGHWEKVLATISEVIDTQLGVQRQWMYLESIFLSSEDIRKQLPSETALFDQVNRTYIDITERMRRDPNAMRACTVPGLLASLNEMDTKLEKIQKSLDQVLGRGWAILCFSLIACLSHTRSLSPSVYLYLSGKAFPWLCWVFVTCVAVAVLVPCGCAGCLS